MRPALLRRLYPYLQNIQNQPDAYRKAFFHINVDPDLQPFFSHIPRWQLTAKLKTFFSDAVRAEIGEDNGYSKVQSELPQSYASWDSFCSGPISRDEIPVTRLYLVVSRRPDGNGALCRRPVPIPRPSRS